MRDRLDLISTRDFHAVADGKEPGSVPVARGRSTLASTAIRRELERLDGLPLRPATARLVLEAALDEEGGPRAEWTPSPRFHAQAGADPGWALAHSRVGWTPTPFEIVQRLPWWRSSMSDAESEALQRLWWHGVAVGLAARRLASEASRTDLDRIERAGMLHGLGLWAIASFLPSWLNDWLAEPTRHVRRAFERESLGTEVSNLGRSLADRWCCDPLIADATWLHADCGEELNAGSSDPSALVFIQQGYELAERTPWRLFPGVFRRGSGSDSRVRILTAEVQVRCASAMIEPGVSTHEERFARAAARLQCETEALRGEREATRLFLNAVSQGEPGESGLTWVGRAAEAWCATPGVTTARVEWTNPSECERLDEPVLLPPRPAGRHLTLNARGPTRAEVQLWLDPNARDFDQSIKEVLPAWDAWVALIVERDRLEQRLEAVLRGHRERIEREESILRDAKFEALAEFAAGAGHELNNPLAVIVGRAQLLLARMSDPDSTRSLRAILGQAQRAHRIIRDLMFVGRTPEPRPRFCQPDEVIKTSVRDLKQEASERGIKLLVEAGEGQSKAWTDPDALRHLADVLLRNAIEWTPAGGTIEVALSGDQNQVAWSIRDNGRGISPREGEHLFDPFFCGRQAGRGLGLGLPRAARIVQQAGGELRWDSQPGQGTIFRVHIPLPAPPKPPALNLDSNARMA